MLIVDENYQRKGPGSKLVEWGMEQVEERIERSIAGGRGERIEGVYLLANPQGGKDL